MTASDRAWLARLPKVELHIHLEGAIPMGALWELVCQHGGDPAVPDLAALERRFAYRDFAHFIDTWVWKNGFLRAYDDFAFVAEKVAEDLCRQNIRYAEVFYSPPDFARHGLATGLLTEAVRRGLDRVPGIEIALVADLVRDFGPARAQRTLAELGEVRGLGVIGVGIGGSEQAHPPEPFAAVYAAARAAGLHTSAHAGEAAGPASVWGALRALSVERVGHGTRAVEDGALMRHLAEHRVPVELCPGSNVKTGVVASLAAHPIRRFLAAGIPVSVNTDDPHMFGTSLVAEYAGLMTEHGLSRAEIRGLIESAIATSWAAPEHRLRLAQRFAAEAAWSEVG